VSRYFLPVFYAVLQLLVLIGIGFAIRRSGKWAEGFFGGLSRLVVRVALPLYFVVRLSRTDLSSFRTLLVMPLASVGVIALGLLSALAVFSLLRFRGSDRRAGIAMATFGNAGYMPLTMAEIVPLTVPVLAERFGMELPPVLIAAYVFVYSPLLWSVGHYILTRHGDAEHRFRFRDLVSPPLVGITIGVALALVGAPQLIENTALPFKPIFSALDQLAGITLPLALLNLGGLIGGLSVSDGNLRELAGIGLAVAFVRFVVLPGAFYGIYFALLRPLGVAAPVLFVIFLQMHTPPATNLSLMAAQAGINEHHTAATLLGTYLLYLVLMPVYLVLFLTVTA
jgi:predicted permease